MSLPRFPSRHVLAACFAAACLPAVAAAADGPYWLRLSDLHVPRPVERPMPPRPATSAPTPAPPSSPSPTSPVPRAPTPPSSPPEEVSTVELGGSYRALAIDGRTPGPDTEPYTQGAHRLRLKLGWRPAPRWLLRVEHDTELTTGSYLQTRYARSPHAAPPRQALGNGSTWLQRPRQRGRQGVFRGFVQYSGEGTTVLAGRQRVPLGVGRFWSTLDMLNPINPLQVERDEFVGVDALFVERAVGEMSRLSLTWAPDPERRDDRWIAQARTHAAGTDVTATYGRYWRDDVLGLDLASQLGDVALRGELAFVRHAGGQHRKLLLGADYVFPNTLSLSAELFHSSEPQAQRLQRWQANPQLAQVQPLGSAYAGLSVGYDLTPLLKASTYLLTNLRDGSRLLYPTLSYAMTANSLVSGGAQRFTGKPGSEYGRGGDLWFVRFQQFF